MDKINIEVAYALPEEQILLMVEVPEGTDIKGVVMRSGILELHPELDIEILELGIFGKLAKMNQIVRDKDRIEIYRPLIADPKEVRRRKAAEGKKLKKGGGSAPEKDA